MTRNPPGDPPGFGLFPFLTVLAITLVSATASAQSFDPATTRAAGMALRSALREDPDIVLIGELRDLETIESALRIAETGHLTLATLHTNSTAQTINRIIDVFPAHQQGQIRTQLSLVLEGIVCQSLLPRADGTGRVVSLEIMKKYNLK